MAHATHPNEISGSSEAGQAPAGSRKPASVHPVAIEIGLAATLWYLAMAWLSFAWGRGIDLDLAVVSLFFVMFFTLFLTTASRAVHDKRWLLRQESFAAFLHDDNIAVDRGKMSGRDVLIEVTLIPVALAFAATLIGLAWMIFG
jgi:hypothetical protein